MWTRLNVFHADFLCLLLVRLRPQAGRGLLHSAFFTNPLPASKLLFATLGGSLAML